MKNLAFILKYFLVPFALCFGLTLQAQLLNETFDNTAGFSITDGSGSANFFASSGGQDYFGIYDGDDDGGADFGATTSNPSGLPNYTSSGDNYLVNEDMDATTEGLNLPATLTWTSIDLSGETILKISADFASTRADADDYIVVSYRLDSGAWVETLGVAGASGTNGPVYEITDFSAQTGDATATAITSAFTNISSTITLAGTEGTIEIKAEFSNNNGDDNFGMDNLVVEVPGATEEAITLSATPATVDEGSTLAVTLSVPTNVDSDTVFSLTSGGDGTELSIPTTATILAGTKSVDFNVSGLSDSEYDVDTAVTITATLAGYTPGTLDITVVDTDFASLTAIHIEGFETDGLNTRYTAPDGNGSDGDQDYFDRISNDTSDRAYTNVQGEFYWGAQDIDDSAAAGVSPASLLITGINIIGGTNLLFSAYFAEQQPEASGEDDIDSGDSVIVEYQIDNGGYKNLIAFEGSGGNNTPIFEDTDFNGTGDGTQLETAFALFRKSITDTGASLDLRFTVSGFGFGDEDIAFDNIQILGLVSDDEAITLSATPTTLDEGSTLAVTLSVPTSVSTDTTFVLGSDGDSSELSIPATVTVPTGASSVDFNISGLSDGVYDGNQDLTITAELAGYISTSLDITVVDTDSRPPLGDIIFTQYYEGASFNKWVEISNIGDSSVDLSSYGIALWGGSESPEDWKTDGGTPYQTLSLSGVTLAAGESYLIANSSAALPFSSSLADVTSDITLFNGNDSLVLYSDPTGYLISNILDAISITVANEAANKGFVRTSVSYGFDFVIGSSIEDYDDDNSGPAVWTQITTAAADAAVDGDDAYLGSTGLVAAADPVAVYLAARSLTSSDLATDTNGNGFTVLEEYLAGFGDGSGLDAISYDIVKGATLALTLTSDLESEPSGIVVDLQATSDLSVAFEDVTSFTISVVGNADGTFTRSYTETSPPDGDERFLRLSITTD